MRLNLVAFCAATFIAAASAGCTVSVSTGKPDITVDCVLVELPGGEVRTDCDAGIPKDASDAAPAPSGP